MRLPVSIILLGWLLTHFCACQNQPQQGLPAGITWQSAEYSRLFTMGTDGKDSFIAFRDPADTAQWLQIVQWGSNLPREGCTVLAKRKRIACMTAVFSGMMEVLGEETKICCTDNIQYHTGPKCQKWFTKSKVTEANKSATLDKEMLLKSKPELVFTYYIDNKGKEEWNRITGQGVPVIFLQNYLENHPLARAEWLKVMGWILGKPREAADFFNMVKEHYESLSAEVRLANVTKPTVFCNAPYSGNWDMPAGGSYIAGLLTDAGADYLWKDVQGVGKVSLDIEKVYQKAQNADFWINPGGCRTLSCLISADKRLGLFSTAKEGTVFNATKTQNKKGGNGWWDYAVVRPDLALHDLVQIFHPELVANDQETVFFEALKP